MVSAPAAEAGSAQQHARGAQQVLWDSALQLETASGVHNACTPAPPRTTATSISAHLAQHGHQCAQLSRQPQEVERASVHEQHQQRSQQVEGLAPGAARHVQAQQHGHEKAAEQVEVLPARQPAQEAGGRAEEPSLGAGAARCGSERSIGSERGMLCPIRWQLSHREQPRPQRCRTCARHGPRATQPSTVRWATAAAARTPALPCHCAAAATPRKCTMRPQKRRPAPAARQHGALVSWSSAGGFRAHPCGSRQGLRGAARCLLAFTAAAVRSGVNH